MSRDPAHSGSPRVPTDEEVAELEKAFGTWYGEGDAEAALGILVTLAPELLERWTIEARIRSDLGEVEAAEVALGRARALGGNDELEVLVAVGVVSLAAWRLDEAREAFERVAQEEADAWLLERLSVLADLDGDFELADRLLAAAHELEPESAPLPPRLAPEEFETLVDEAARDLPDEFRLHLDEVAVVIDPMPSGPMEQPPELLGLFVGIPLGERESGASGELPPTIYLYQRNLERVVLTREELRREIRITLYHELGHFLGFDEHGVEEMGLG